MHESFECQKLLGEISNLIDGTISPELCSELEMHMQECRDCRIVVDTTRKTVELYRTEESGMGMPQSAREKLWVRLDLGDFTTKNKSL